jgi:hypothetical protein
MTDNVKQDNTGNIRVYLVPDDVAGQKVLRLCPRRGSEPAPEGGELVAEVPDEMVYQILQQQMREVAAARGVLFEGPRARR